MQPTCAHPWRDCYKFTDLLVMDFEVNNFFETVGEWLRKTIREELAQVIAEENAKARPQRTYTRQQVANMAHITLATLWRRVNEGQITPIKNGRRVLFAEDEVKRFLHKN